MSLTSATSVMIGWVIATTKNRCLHKSNASQGIDRPTKDASCSSCHTAKQAKNRVYENKFRSAEVCAVIHSDYVRQEAYEVSQRLPLLCDVY